MDEEKLAAHHGKVLKYAWTLDGGRAGNCRCALWQRAEDPGTFKGYVQDAENVASGGKFTFSSLPSSATGQYDRLYDAYASGDKDEAQAAVKSWWPWARRIKSTSS